ncbi:aspartate--tRNA ligase dps1, partial [Linderina pennispora]
MSEQEQTPASQVAEVAKNLENVVLDAEGKPLSKKALKKLEKEREKEARKQERLAREAAERAAREAAEVDFAKESYGNAPLNMSQTKTDTKWTEIKTLGEAMVGQTVNVQARVQTSRATGNKMCFLVLREATATVQALVLANKDTISKQMVKFSTRYVDFCFVRT